MPVKPLNLSIASGRQSIGPEQHKSLVLQVPEELKASYKIEIHFGKDRSPRGLCSGIIIIWESGKRFHGGGDQKMYWCGWPDCGKPFSSDHFGYMHCVCPVCGKEQFLDEHSRIEHIKSLRKDGRRSEGIEKLPIVIGDRFFKLHPPKIADLLVTVFNDLERDADIYLKFHPLDIRYDPKHERTADIDRLHAGRAQRIPLIYTLKAILKDTKAGADLRARFLAMITS